MIPIADKSKGPHSGPDDRVGRVTVTGQAFYPGSPGSIPGRSIYFDLTRFPLGFLVLGGGVFKRRFTTSLNGMEARLIGLLRFSSSILRDVNSGTGGANVLSVNDGTTA